MRHYYTAEGRGAHWAASTNCFGVVLAQLQDVLGDQVRCSLTPAEARAFAAHLLNEATLAEQQPSQAEFIARTLGIEPPAPRPPADKAPLSLAAFMASHPEIEWGSRDAPNVVYASPQSRWLIQQQSATRLDQVGVGLARREALAAAGHCDTELDAEDLGTTLVAALADNLSLFELQAVQRAFTRALQSAETRKQAHLAAYLGSGSHAD